MFTDIPRPGLRLSRRRFVSFAAGATVLVAAQGRLISLGANAQSSSGGSTFLDPSFVHDISATFDQTMYDAMIQNYSETGDKDWIEATMSIDGATYEKVGMRLKGNSSLGGLRSPGGDNGPRAQAFIVVDGTPVAIDPSSPDFPQFDGTPVAENGQGNFRVGGPGGEVSADRPEGLPWLVRLDKYVDDRNHNGITELVIRSNHSATSLNEAVALDLLTEAGLASQLAAFTGFSVNASDPVLRLAIEHPDDAWMTLHFAEDGLLFKSESTGDWSYRGEDPASYDEVFDLEAGSAGDDEADFKPLTGFLDFLNNSDDATFAAELPARLDVEGFAIYLAMMDLIDNFDDIDGPGNNSYLYYEPGLDQFTVVPWDMNLSFSGMGIVIMKGGTLPEGGGPGVVSGSSVGGSISSADATPVAGQEFSTNQGRGGVTGPPGTSNPLVNRFNAVPDFSALFEDQKARLRSELYDNGVAAGILGVWVGVLEAGAGSMIEQATLTSESEALLNYFTQS